jgi:uncharacterized integral membrane protein (TIGR00697 family)
VALVLLHPDPEVRKFLVYTKLYPIMKQKITTFSIAIIASYIALQIFSDIGSLKIAAITIPFLGVQAIDGGTFLYPFTFTLRDLLHKNLGKSATRKIIILAAILNLFMAGFFWFVTALPADNSWGLQSEFTAILGPIWQIVIASIIAEVISELIDTEAYSFFVRKISKKHQWGRVLFSNAFSIPIDSLIFAFIAFTGSLPVSIIWSIVLTNVIIKFAITLISLPSIYLSSAESDDI